MHQNEEVIFQLNFEGRVHAPCAVCRIPNTLEPKKVALRIGCWLVVICLQAISFISVCIFDIEIRAIDHEWSSSLPNEECTCNEMYVYVACIKCSFFVSGCKNMQCMQLITESRFHSGIPDSCNIPGTILTKPLPYTFYLSIYLTIYNLYWIHQISCCS